MISNYLLLDVSNWESRDENTLAMPLYLLEELRAQGEFYATVKNGNTTYLSLYVGLLAIVGLFGRCGILDFCLLKGNSGLSLTQNRL